MDISPFSVAAGGLRVRVRLSPRASANKITAIEKDGQGRGILKVMVTAVAEAGKANAALVKLLGAQWKLPKSAISVVQGGTSRNKTVFIAGETDALSGRLHQWLDKFQE